MRYQILFVILQTFSKQFMHRDRMHELNFLMQSLSLESNVHETLPIETRLIFGNLTKYNGH